MSDWKEIEDVERPCGEDNGWCGWCGNLSLIHISEPTRPY